MFTQNTISKHFDKTSVSLPFPKRVEAPCDRFMPLDAEPYSTEAIALTDYLSECIHIALDRTYRLTPKLRQALGSTIADLLANAIGDRQRYGFRPMALADFNGMAVGYKPFRSVVEALKGMNLLEVQVGIRGSLPGGSRQGEATRMRAKTALLELALLYGVTPDNWAVHFRQMPRIASVTNSIILRSSSTNFYGKKLPGENMRIDKRLPIVRRLGRQVNQINGFLADQDLWLGNYYHRHFVRIFGQGDCGESEFSKGGRLYSPGKDSYQQMPSAERRHIRINGQPTIELDIKSSFLKNYRAYCGLPFDPAADPYAIDDLPRQVAKSWVVMTFGHNAFHRAWPKGAKARYRKDGLGTGDLQRDHPIADTRNRILDSLPELKAWPTSGIGWGDLQYVESCAVTDTVHALAMRGAVALPVHDSIIVAAPSRALAETTLITAFEKHVGVRPHLEAKSEAAWVAQV